MIRKPQLDYYKMGVGVTTFSTTRHGGCSKSHPASSNCPSENYTAFNINRYCGDSEEHIRQNRKTLCSLLGINDDRLLMPHQVHLTKTARIDEALLSLSENQRREALEGYDALMTDLKGVCIGVSTADCHAGWRGTVGRIVQKTVGAMREAYSTQPQYLVAQIGPGIHIDSFEVGDEVYAVFEKADFDMPSISKRYAAADVGRKWHIDLPECNRQQLVAAGLSPQNIRVSPICTYQQYADYFSARRLGINSGRIFTGIMVLGAHTGTTPM